MYSPKYVDYLDKMRIKSAFYNPKSKPKTWVGMISETRKSLILLGFWGVKAFRGNDLATIFRYSQKES